MHGHLILARILYTVSFFFLFCFCFVAKNQCISEGILAHGHCLSGSSKQYQNRDCCIRSIGINYDKHIFVCLMGGGGAVRSFKHLKRKKGQRWHIIRILRNRYAVIINFWQPTVSKWKVFLCEMGC